MVCLGTSEVSPLTFCEPSSLPILGLFRGSIYKKHNNEEEGLKAHSTGLNHLIRLGVKCLCKV